MKKIADEQLKTLNYHLNDEPDLTKLKEALILLIRDHESQGLTRQTGLSMDTLHKYLEDEDPERLFFVLMKVVNALSLTLNFARK